MNETSKSEAMRRKLRHFEKYLHGKGLDVGCGSDPLQIVEGNVTPWDLSNGDAQFLNDVSDGSFDFVYSSHCLEHLHAVSTAIFHWARVCRSGGFLYIVVPEWSFYEHRCWPSLHNQDHKASFSLLECEIPADHPHYTLAHLIEIGRAHGLELMDSALELDGFVFALHRLEAPFTDQTVYGAQAQMLVIWRKL